jgi:hypothetical protein
LSIQAPLHFSLQVVDKQLEDRPMRWVLLAALLVLVGCGKEKVEFQTVPSKLSDYTNTKPNK